MPGPVQERFNNTRLNNPLLVEVVRSSIVLVNEAPPFVVNPPSAISNVEDFNDLHDTYRYWERREGMRGQILSGRIVLNRCNVLTGSLDYDQRNNQNKSFREI